MFVCVGELSGGGSTPLFTCGRESRSCGIGGSVHVAPVICVGDLALLPCVFFIQSSLPRDNNQSLSQPQFS